MTELDFFPVTQKTWPDFETLFVQPGGPKYCWCMSWRELADRQSASSPDKKKAMAAIVAAGTPVGIIARSGAEVIGWCSVAPRETFRKLSPHQDDSEKGIWSIVCFFVTRPHRKSGVGAALLDAAIEYAHNNGASAVEAYPVDPDSPSFRFMGFKAMFAARGFRAIGMAGSRRHVMRLEG
ncbi:GNAT family N-acetyltransferase [Mesorhizobium sp. INR15]|uniref:GNAT family N-acetyltransferase n=1 Tax=Mesorhizobium sp. INR15 TaxID=2654248 RepID=UPI00189667ED|nr:GNAT family N-acetyltransferase [Mesorhizobium sp. INR15]QPC93030.1 GNAT family N-acetyltransferase [Mesorhizobium sp. INR15]